MKLSYILLFILFNLSINSFAQTDTLFVNNEKISCVVREITVDAVKFSYDGEELINSIYKNSVQKIIFKSGRVQIFSEATSFKTVNSVDEYSKVSMTSLESEVGGLYKLGDVSSKAKGATTLSNQDIVKERAYSKMKIEAAMMGGNIIYLTDQRTEGNQIGGYFQTGSTTEASLTGIVYSNKLPNAEAFLKLIDNRIEFKVDEIYKMKAIGADYKKSSSKWKFKILNVVNENGIVMIEAKLDGFDKEAQFMLAGFTDDYFNVFYKNKAAIYNFKLMF